MIKGPQVLESTRRVDTVVLDKTGTITTGRMSLIGVHAVDGETDTEALMLAGAVETGSQHPIGRAIAAAAAPTDGTPPPSVDGFTSHDGYGVSGVVAGHAVLVGRRNWLSDDWSLAAPDALCGVAESAEAPRPHRGMVAWDGAVPGRDRRRRPSSRTPRPRQSVSSATLGLRPVLLTGTTSVPPRRWAAQVGIDPSDVIAGVLPVDKVAAVKDLQARGASWRWSATASTTPRHWSKPIWAWPWVPAPTSPSRRRT